jgi:RecB family exonuclease
LIGRIDRVDEIGDDLELIDYKTGTAKDQKTVDKDAQLTMYAMASQNLFGKLPKSLALYFIEDNLKVNTTRTVDAA